MSSLFDNLSKDTGEEMVKISSEGDFPIKLNMFRDTVVKDFNQYNIGLSKGIAKIAADNNLNDNQIGRIVEEVNNSVYLEKYAQVRKYPEREVVFDLASVPDVKTIVSGGELSKTATIEKKASWENDETLDKLDFLNCQTREISLTSEVKPTLTKHLIQKLANEVSELSKEKENKMQKLANDIYTIGEAMICYDRMNKDAQGIFNEICKEAQLDKHSQMLIKKAIDQKVSQLKEVKTYSTDYTFNVDFADISERTAFSLGEFSMIKVAETSKSNQATPVIVTDNGSIFKSINDLINMAKGIKTKQSEVGMLNQKQQKVASIIEKGAVQNV